MAKYMLIWRATDESNARMATAAFGEMLESVGRFNDELIRAGVLLAAEGLDDASQGVVVDFTGETPVVTDGPCGETKGQEVAHGAKPRDVGLGPVPSSHPKPAREGLRSQPRAHRSRAPQGADTRLTRT